MQLFTSHNQDSGDSFATLLKRLGSRRPAERDAARLALAQMGPDALPRLMAYWEQETALLLKRTARYERGLAGGVIAWIGLAIVFAQMGWLPGHWEGLAGFSIFLSLVLFVIGRFWTGWKRQGVPLQATALRALAAIDDLRSVGILLDMRRNGDAALRPHVVALLIRLLPRLRAEHATLLSAEQRAFLRRQLDPFNDYRSLLPAVLEAVAQLDDRAALPMVYALCVADVRLEPGLREAAWSVLQRLAARTDFGSTQDIGRLLVTYKQATDWYDSDIDEESIALTKVSLLHLLPRLQPEDASMLTARHRDTLHQILQNCDGERESELILAALHAVAQVGEESSLNVALRLARSRRPRRVREAAEACVVTLQSRMKEENARQTLLRASVASHEDPATMLRAVTSSQETQPEQLLRAFPSDDETNA